MQRNFKTKALRGLVSSLFVVAPAALASDNITTDKIEVISTTPLPSVGLPVNQIPANVQTVKGEDLEKSKSLDVTDYMNRQLGSVYINEIQNNPLQPDLNYRGFTASPLLGTPQGLSVYVDGIRMNQAFGDIVSWDLIPKNAIEGMQVMPGSNPLFGLNTLGGAISIKTKDGRSNPGGAAQVTLGSYARKIAEIEYGGANDNVDYFVAGTFFDEDGWRDKSDSDYQQLFGKLGWRGEKTDLKLSYAYANTDLNGNGLVPESFARRNYDSVYTYPDNTKNESHLVNLEWSHFFTDNVQMSGNTYYRNIKTRTYNGDINDDALPEFVRLPTTNGGAGQNILLAPGGTYTVAGNLAACQAEFGPGDEPGEKCTGMINRTSTETDNGGIFGQFSVNNTLFGKDNQYIVGAGVDYSHIKFNQTAEYGVVDLNRGIIGTGVFSTAANAFDIDGELDDRSAKLKSDVTTWSLFGTDTISLQDNLHLTISGRYNHTKIKNKDGQYHPEYIGSGAFSGDEDEEASLDGTHKFNRFNPAIGLTWGPNTSLNTYVGYNEGSRAPTSIELSCANPEAPCSLPNSFAGDPPLKKVVSKTWEAGIRGSEGNLNWSLGLFATRNQDDILFVSANSSQGFFKNFGQTKRQGLEAALTTEIGQLNLGANYTFIDATYQSSETVLGPANSSATQIDTGGDAYKVFNIKSGDRIPLVPRNMLKLYADYKINDKWSLGLNSLTVDESYIRGNDNNDHEATGPFAGNGKISGYTVFNLAAAFQFNPEWTLFARMNNVFDKEYYTAGMLGQNPFNSNGVLRTDGSANNGAVNNRRTNSIGEDFVAPGAPRTAWIGVRYEFGGRKSSNIKDRD